MFIPWSAAAQTINALAALFDARLTAARSDDSLIVRIPTESIHFNSVHYLNERAPVADLPFEAGAVYRLVFQINPTADWDFEPKDSGKGLFALAGTTGRFGRAAGPIPDTSELLLTNTFVEDEYADSIDFVVGLTKKSNPRVPWNMVSDPFADPDLEDKTGEIGSLVNTVPAGTAIDCLDDNKTWELTGNCEKERYYFYELWFMSDLDWEHGDTVDVYLHLEGKPVPLNIDELHLRFRLVDDDAIPPAISDFSPEIVPSGLGFTISCKISDPSGVYDDGTGSSGQGVYLLWDDDGSLADGAHEIRMSPVGGGYYASDAQIGPRSPGDRIVYAVYACDDDADAGRINDRGCGASDVRTVQILGSVYLFDEPNSLYPAAAYAGEEGVSIHLELNNPMLFDFVLYQTSNVSFSDGTHSVTGNLRNVTTVPAGASNFPVSFDAVDVPSDFIAPDTIGLTLEMTGMYGLMPFDQAWTASVSNRLVMKKPRVLFTARPAFSGDVHPGDAVVELLRIDVMNDSPKTVSIDSMVLSNATAGGGGAPLNDADFGPLRLYARAGAFARNDEPLRDSLAAVATVGDGIEGADALSGLETAAGGFDSLLAWARFEGGEARLRFPGGRSIPAGTTGYWYIAADVDSFLASDGDSLDIAIVSSDSVFVAGGATAEFSNTPVNSEGKCAIDGFMSFQLAIDETIPDTLYLGDPGQPVLSFIVPVNGHVPDVLSAVSVDNFGD
ncbi:MAG: hypothetical protein NTW97_03765, partial [Candidatus Krumholzibacteria bacterium]|nr:hypothetical protein [Candidatus Krumholzibacteria bacterium]